MSGLRQVLEQLIQPFDQPVALGLGNTSPDKIRIRLKLNGATLEEIDFLMTGQRVELNAISSNSFRL
jgi:hypothetical protein